VAPSFTLLTKLTVHFVRNVLVVVVAAAAAAELLPRWRLMLTGAYHKIG